MEIPVGETVTYQRFGNEESEARLNAKLDEYNIHQSKQNNDNIIMDNVNDNRLEVNLTALEDLTLEVKSVADRNDRRKESEMDEFGVLDTHALNEKTIVNGFGTVDYRDIEILNHTPGMEVNNAALNVQGTFEKVVSLIKQSVIQISDCSAIEWTNVMDDSGANVKIAADGSVLKNARNSNAGVAGVHGDTNVLSLVGEMGLFKDVYSGIGFDKSIIPPQLYVECLGGKIMLLHMQIQIDPPIHLIFSFEPDEPVEILAVACPQTSNIMMWTSNALRKVGLTEFKVLGQLKFSVDENKLLEEPWESFKVMTREVNATAYVAISMAYVTFMSNITELGANVTLAQHMDETNGTRMLNKRMMLGVSSRSIRNQRISGLDRTQQSIDDESDPGYLDLLERMAKFKRTRRPKTGERVTSQFDGGPLTDLLADVLFFSDLETASGKLNFATLGGYTAMLVVVDKFTRMGWVHPIRTEKQDFMGALRTITLSIVQFGKERGGKLPWAPCLLFADKAANQSPASLKTYCKDFDMIIRPVRPGSNGMKILDRYMLSLREYTNYGMDLIDRQYSLASHIMIEANRRMRYFSSADGLTPSPFEMATGVVPSIDFLYPPIGTITLAKPSLTTKVGCSTALYLGTDEQEGSYLLWFPRTNSIVKRSDTLFITIPGPPDKIFRMMSGQQLYDENQLAEGHIVDLTERLRGPIYIQDMTSPFKGYWIELMRNASNMPLPEPWRCMCGKAFESRKALHTHWKLFQKQFGTPDHVDPKIRPTNLTKREKERVKDYKHLIMEDLLRNPPKNAIPSVLNTLAKDLKTTSEYNLRNRKVDGSKMGEKLRQLKVDKINERRHKLIQKTGSKKSIDRLKAKLVLKQEMIECPMDGCKAMVKGPTPTGRQSKDMKLHLLLHKKDDEEIPANVVEASLAAHNMTAHISVLNDNFRLNPHATDYKPAAKTKLDFDTDSEVDDTTNVREYDEKYLSVIENTLKQVYCANVITTSVSFDAAIHDENIPVAALVKEANVVTVNDTAETKSECYAGAVKLKNLHVKTPMIIPQTKRKDWGCDEDLLIQQYERTQTAQLKSAAAADIIAIEQWFYESGYRDTKNSKNTVPQFTVNEARALFYGENHESNIDQILVRDPLPSIEPMEEPYTLDFEAMLQQEKTKFFVNGTKIDPKWVNSLDSREFLIPTVNTASVIIDPRVETGMLTGFDYNNMNKILDNLTYANIRDYIPNNDRDVARSPLLPKFLESRRSELDNLSKLATWTIEKCPHGTKPINTRFVDTIKWNIEKQCMEKVKSRLVAQGFRQIAYDTYDPNQISSPVMMSSSMNAICSLAAELHLPMHTLDIKNAYITACLDRKIWIRLPSFCTVLNGDVVMKDKTMLLKKALYGLKNSSSAWFAELSKFLLNTGFTQSEQDPCVFTFIGEDGVTCILGCHVDDLLIASTPGYFETTLLPAANKWFPFGLTHGSASQFLGCMIEQDVENGIVTINQEERIKKIATTFGITKLEATPLPRGKALDDIFSVDSLADTDRKQQHTIEDLNNDKSLPYFKNYGEVRTYFRGYTGNLVYMCCYGRPDVQAIVYKLARYQENPSKVHIMAARRVIGYLLKTKSRKLTFGKQKMPGVLNTFVDSSFADCPATGRSSGGYVHFLFGSYLSSRSFKLNCVTRSVTEAEFYTMSAAAADSIYFRNFFNDTLRPICVNSNKFSGGEGTKRKFDEIKVVPVVRTNKENFHDVLLSKEVHPFRYMKEEDTFIHCDNASAINQAQKGANKRSKHIRIHQSYIWEQIHIFKRVVVLKVDTKYNPADLQTKPLNAELYNRHTRTIMGERDCFVKFASGD